MDISKKDWKLFRERLSGWQEKYMEGLVKEYVVLCQDLVQVKMRNFSPF